MKNNNLLGGDRVHAYTFGRLDCAIGDRPNRFDGTELGHLKAEYLRGYGAMHSRLLKPAEINPEFANEFPHRL